MFHIVDDCSRTINLVVVCDNYIWQMTKLSSGLRHMALHAYDNNNNNNNNNILYCFIRVCFSWTFCDYEIKT